MDKEEEGKEVENNIKKSLKPTMQERTVRENRFC